MKKTVLLAAAALLAGSMLSACSNKEKNADTGVIIEEEAVGEVVEMPAESSAQADTVIATADAVAVDTAAPAK